MEWVLRQECPAELGIAQRTVVVFIVARHKNGHLVFSDFEAKLFQTLNHVLSARWAWARLVEYSECVNQVKVWLDTKLNLDFLDSALKV